MTPSLRSAVKQLEKHSDYYIAHEYLEIFNNPCYLLAFVSTETTARAALLSALQTLFRINMLRYSLETSPYDQQDNTQQTQPTLLAGVSHLYQQRQDPNFGIGLFNLWHDSANIQLKKAEAFVLRHIDGNNSPKELATLLRDALNRLLDENDTSLTLTTLTSAAKALGKNFRFELV